MASMRKPKRIIIRGHDEKEYPFLVKGGEDLRQDQRIEQLFEVMNVILSHDAACGQRNMQLRTYRVVPMTSRYSASSASAGRRKEGQRKIKKRREKERERTHLGLS
jgi:hypothetical protein